MADIRTTPVTEESNVITEGIDVASAQDIPILLGKCDQEIFDGWQTYPSISSAGIVATIERVTKLAANIFQNPDGCGIVLSGCGTSGRLAFFLARSFNGILKQLHKPSCCEYLIAGGDKALLTSQEAPEDRPDIGAHDLSQVCSKHKWKKVLFVGITCGLSAPYVAGQLHHCMEHLDYFTPVLVGFNPINLARDNPIEGWDLTFRQTAQKMQQLQEKGKAFVLNPVVGPEAITGSSRMKGGSATKILLELILWSALLQAHKPSSTEGVVSSLALLKLYQTVLDTVRQHSNVSSECIKLAGNSFNCGGHVYYIGADSLGILAIIDASECPPTFGATLDDIRGFLPGGYEVYCNSEGDISSLGEAFQISTGYFMQNVVPQLGSYDTVIFLLSQPNDDITRLPKLVKHQCPESIIVGLHFTQPTSTQNIDSLKDVVDYYREISLPWNDLLCDLKPTGITSWSQPLAFQAAQFAVEIATKWTLNSISTGAHILKGKVYKNFMVDLKLSNSKLFHRGTGIVQRFAQCSAEEARQAILKALYDVDEVLVELDKAPVSQHNLVATNKDKVIPTALLLAIQKCSVEEAKSSLLKTPVIREAIAKLCG